MDPDIADLVHAINDDLALKNRLLSILKNPPESRGFLLQKLAKELEENQAPEYLIKTFLGLQNNSLAQKVKEALGEGI